MRTPSLSAVVSFAIVASSFATVAHGQESCSGGGAVPPGVGPGVPFGDGVFNPADPYQQPYQSPSAVQPASHVAPRPTAPQARITVVDAGSPFKSPANAAKVPATTARITVVADELPRANAIAKVAEANSAESVNEELAADAGLSSAEDDEALSDALKGLVGTWKAVARRGDGELTTVELRLDNRGWAELTVPGADGKPSTIKRRAELDGEQLKLTGPDSELLLGQLLDVTSRQMVLARSGGQVTFVRP